MNDPELDAPVVGDELAEAPATDVEQEAPAVAEVEDAVTDEQPDDGEVTVSEDISTPELPAKEPMFITPEELMSQGAVSEDLPEPTQEAGGDGPADGLASDEPDIPEGVEVVDVVQGSLPWAMEQVRKGIRVARAQGQQIGKMLEPEHMRNGVHLSYEDVIATDWTAI